MFSGGFFSLGLISPILLLSIGFVAISLSCSGLATAIRIYGSSGFVTRTSQLKIDWAIGVLAASGLSPVIGGLVFRYWDGRAGTFVALAGLVLLWPASISLAIWGRGMGRTVILVGQALIAFWLIAISWVVWAHGMGWPRLL